AANAGSHRATNRGLRAQIHRQSPDRGARRPKESRRRAAVVPMRPQMKPAFSLEGKVAIITGASRGIGAGIARRFSDAGASIVICARKLEQLGELAAEIEKAGGRALAVAAHMGKLDNVEALLRQAVERFGKVDVLVNNAATNPYFGPICDITDAA